MAVEFPPIRLQLPIFDQEGNQVGWFAKSPDEMMRVEGYRDEHGNMWVPPTAFAYQAVCAASARKDIALRKALDLLPVKLHDEVERLMRPPLAS